MYYILERSTSRKRRKDFFRGENEKERGFGSSHININSNLRIIQLFYIRFLYRYYNPEL